MNENNEISKFIVPRELDYFKSLYENYYSKLVRFAEAIVFDTEEAKDIVQEVFFNLWDRSGNFQISTNISGYLFTAVKNKALNHIKSNKIHDKHQDLIREAWIFSEHLEADNNDELISQLFKVIDNFPAQMKKAILLRTTRDLKYEEIAREMNLSLNTVKTHLKNAFRLLRQTPLTALIYFVFQYFK
jgi:RNA polymerase sigma-70 factor (family 1)